MDTHIQTIELPVLRSCPIHTSILRFSTLAWLMPYMTSLVPSRRPYLDSVPRAGQAGPGRASLIHSLCLRDKKRVTQLRST